MAFRADRGPAKDPRDVPTDAECKSPTLAPAGARAGQIAFKPFALPTDDQSLSQYGQSCDSDDRNANAMCTAFSLPVQRALYEAKSPQEQAVSNSAETSSAFPSVSYSVKPRGAKKADGNVAQPNSVSKHPRKAFRMSANPELHLDDWKPSPELVANKGSVGKGGPAKPAFGRNLMHGSSLSKASPAPGKTLQLSKAVSSRVIPVGQMGKKSSFQARKGSAKVATLTKTNSTAPGKLSKLGHNTVKPGEGKADQEAEPAQKAPALNHYCTEREKIKVSKKLVASIRQKIASSHCTSSEVLQKN